MNEILKKNRTVVSLLIFTLVIIPGFGFGYAYLVSKIEDKANTIRKVKIDQEVNQNFLASVGQLRQSKDNVAAKQENLSVLLGGDASAKIGLYGDIESIARSTGHSFVANQIIDPESLTQQRASINNQDDELIIKPYSDQALIVEISLVGTYSNFLDFLNKIENFGYLVDIQKIKVKARVRSERDKRLLTENEQKDIENEDQRDNLVESNVEIAVYLETLSDKSAELRDAAEMALEDDENITIE